MGEEPVEEVNNCSVDAEWSTNDESDGFNVDRVGITRDGVDLELWTIATPGSLDNGCELVSAENKSTKSVSIQNEKCSYSFEPITDSGSHSTLTISGANCGCVASKILRAKKPCTGGEDL